MIKNKLKTIEKIAQRKSREHYDKGCLKIGDSIFIKTMFALNGIIHVKECGDLKPGTRIFITSGLFRFLNKSEEEIESIKQKYIEEENKKMIQKEKAEEKEIVPVDNSTEIIERMQLPTEKIFNSYR